MVKATSFKKQLKPFFRELNENGKHYSEVWLIKAYRNKFDLHVKVNHPTYGHSLEIKFLIETLAAKAPEELKLIDSVCIHDHHEEIEYEFKDTIVLSETADELTNRPIDL